MSFTYSGPSVAAAFVAGVFNDAETRTQAAASDATAEFASARAAVAVTPDSLAGAITTAPTITPTDIDLSVLLDRQGELAASSDDRATMLTALVGDLDAFLAEFFPGVDAAVASARDALTALLAGSNFADGRELAGLRLEQAKDKQRRGVHDAEDKAISSFAERNFPAPPGELMHQLGELRKGNLYELADQAWEFDAAEAAREKEALERTLRLLVSARADAIKAFSAYLSAACIARYDKALAQTEASHRATQTLADSLYQQLAATNRAGALQLRAQEAEHGLTRGYLSGLDRLAEQQAAAQLAAATAMAKVLGTQAATAYNNMRVGASVRGTEEMSDL